MTFVILRINIKYNKCFVKDIGTLIAEEEDGQNGQVLFCLFDLTMTEEFRKIQNNVKGNLHRLFSLYASNMYLSRYFIAQKIKCLPRRTTEPR